MKKILLLHILFILGTTTIFAQYSKGVDKILELHKTDPEKARLKMGKFVHKKGSGKDWDLYVNMYHFKYRVAKDSLNNAELAKTAMAEFIEICKEATLQAYSIDASRYLIKYLMKGTVDNEINSSAEEKLKVAENFFLQKKYVLAAEHYQEAVELDAKYYRARLYLGLCYMNMRRYEGAKFQFQEVIRMFPTEIEPREYLVDSYMETHDYKDAFQRCLDLIYLYPSIEAFSKVTQIMAEEKKGFNRFWFPREFEINIIGKNQIGEYPPAWQAYREAKTEIEPYCDEFGNIIAKNNLTGAKHLEVYAWEKMLAHPEAKGQMFDLARRMQKRNFLDCFVFISMFHHDLYPQYEEFIKNNKRKVKQYFDTALIQ